MPPFLITCCQWDYVPLGAQARTFYKALREAGGTAGLHFTPHESHISEMLSVTHDDDPTAKALLQFMR
jgi:dipeptidyl aminopeptidase/acylaminoacyl peptidase